MLSSWITESPGSVFTSNAAAGVVLGAVLNGALPAALKRVPPEATVLGSEPALVEAFDEDRLGADPAMQEHLDNLVHLAKQLHLRTAQLELQT